MSKRSCARAMCLALMFLLTACSGGNSGSGDGSPDGSNADARDAADGPNAMDVRDGGDASSPADVVMVGTNGDDGAQAADVSDGGAGDGGGRDVAPVDSSSDGAGVDIVPVDVPSSDGAGSDVAADGSTSDGSAMDSSTSCPTGEHLCGTTCSSDMSVDSCGATSCTSCPMPANAMATCDGTSCGFTCLGGFADCNSSASDGCETSLATTSDCGSCGNVCTAPAGGTATCSGATCGFTCGAPLTMCPTSCANVGSDPANCGSCGNACTLYRGCDSATCDWLNLLAAVNAVRTAGHTCSDGTVFPPVAALTYDTRIEQAALQYDNYAVSMNLDYTVLNGSETGSYPTPGDRLHLYSYTWTTWYEVSGVGDGTETPTSLVNDLLLSNPSTCAALMSASYTQMGFGAVTGTLYPTYITFLLAHP